LALALSILPYLFSKKTDISSILLESYNAFTAEEIAPEAGFASDTTTAVTVIRTSPESTATTSQSHDSTRTNTNDDIIDSNIHNGSSININRDSRTLSSRVTSSTTHASTTSTGVSQIFSAMWRTILSSGSSPTLRSQALITWTETLHLYSFLVHGR
jgi:hypothetical protein